jgi:hypothetical protein
MEIRFCQSHRYKKNEREITREKSIIRIKELQLISPENDCSSKLPSR